MTVKEIVEEHMKAAERVNKRLMTSPKERRALLVRIGVWKKTRKLPSKKSK